MIWLENVIVIEFDLIFLHFKDMKELNKVCH